MLECSDLGLRCGISEPNHPITLDLPSGRGQNPPPAPRESRTRPGWWASRWSMYHACRGLRVRKNIHTFVNCGETKSMNIFMANSEGRSIAECSHHNSCRSVLKESKIRPVSSPNHSPNHTCIGCPRSAPPAPPPTRAAQSRRRPGSTRGAACWCRTCP